MLIAPPEQPQSSPRGARGWAGLSRAALRWAWLGWAGCFPIDILDFQFRSLVFLWVSIELLCFILFSIEFHWCSLMLEGLSLEALAAGLGCASLGWARPGLLFSNGFHRFTWLSLLFRWVFYIVY